MLQKSPMYAYIPAKAEFGVRVRIRFPRTQKRIRTLTPN